MLESVPRGFNASMLILQRNGYHWFSIQRASVCPQATTFQNERCVTSQGPQRCWHLPGYAYIHRANVDPFWPRLAPTTHTYDSNWNSRAATSIFPHPKSYGTSRPPLPYDAMAPRVPLWVLYKRREKKPDSMERGLCFQCCRKTRNNILLQALDLMIPCSGPRWDWPGSNWQPRSWGSVPARLRLAHTIKPCVIN